jgi:hypothetical protein
MNIRKIIKEEIDDFDWTEETSDIPETEGDLVIGQTYYTNPPHDDDHWVKYIYNGCCDEDGDHEWVSKYGETMSYTSEYTQELLKNGQLTTIKPTDNKPIMYESEFGWVSDRLSRDDIEFVASDLLDRTEVRVVNGFHFQKVFIDGLINDGVPHSFYPQFLLTPPSKEASIYKSFLKILKNNYSFSDDDLFRIFERYRELVLPYIKNETGLLT